MTALVGWSQVEGRSHMTVTARARKSLARLVSAYRYLLLVASLLFLRKGHPMVSYSVENWSASVVTVAVL